MEETQLDVHKVLFTTLEASVVGLTAGVPTNKPDFERKLAGKAAAQRAAREAGSAK